MVSEYWKKRQEERKKRIAKEKDASSVQNASKNPAHFCMGCDKYLGHRGFCSDKCHNEYYDHQGDLLSPESSAGEVKGLQPLPGASNLNNTNNEVKDGND